MGFIIILDFVNINHFYYYRVIFLIIPIVINMVFAISVLIREYQQHRKEKWEDFEHVIRIFTLLSFIDNEALCALHSGCWLDKPYFKIEFSSHFKEVTKYGFLIKFFL